MLRRVARISPVVFERNVDPTFVSGFERFAEEILCISVVKVLTAQAVDATQYQCPVIRVLLQGGTDLQRKVAAPGAVGIAAVTDNGGTNVLQRRTNFVGRERPQYIRRNDADLVALVSHPVGDFLGVFRRRVQQHDGYFRIVHPVCINGGMVASGERPQFCKDFGNNAPRRFHGLVLLHLVIDQVRIVHVRTEGHWPLGIEGAIRILPFTEKFANRIRVVEAVDAALLVAGYEAIVSNHDGQSYIRMLAYLDGGEIHVVNGLRIARQQNNPTGVEYEIDVGVVAADVEWSRHRAGRDIQHHGDTRARLHGQLFQ